MTRHFGVLVPSTNTTVETEYTRLLPPFLQAHYARLGKARDIAFAPSRDDDPARISHRSWGRHGAYRATG